jgi:transketolase
MRLDERSIHLRRLAVRCLKGGERGHIGSTMSLIEIMRVLYDKFFDDDIILSKGHGCIAQYVMLVDKGLVPVEELDKFCRKDGILGGHPAPHVPGVICHTGALGHGLSIGVGLALAAKMKNTGKHVFIVMGDGEINEGSVWEAAMSASKLQLDNLTVIIDYNKIQSSGFVKDIQPLEPLAKKWGAFGFHTIEINGHDIDDLYDAVMEHGGGGMPACLIAHTIKGKGISFAENDPMWHHKSALTPQMIADMEAALDAQTER